ncbi:hypothetical protein [Streptomyces sp. x-80]|uniref:hypothetical protein n=1 Tax=Streptomyces sp. x-80 TaxID=2789282 RepID=UPI00397EBF16
MTPIDQFLARALLLEEPHVYRDVVPYQDSGAVFPPDGRDSLGCASGRHQASHTAAHELQILCESVVAYTVDTLLQDFITEQLPEPHGARVLGCILQLTDAEDGARFWWQYAAGAGDAASSYCLYLHHLSLGETDAAAWWRQQTQLDAQPAPQQAVTILFPEPITNLDSSIPTVLRVLGQLSDSSRSRTELVDAVMDYVSVAVGYVDNPDFEIPLPREDFAVQIAVILAVETALSTSLAPRQSMASRQLSRLQRRSDASPCPSGR